MAGNPAAKKGEKIHAYLMLDVIREVKEGVDIGSYAPAQEVETGDVTIREDFPGTGTHAFRFEDGPITWHATGVYLTSGEVIDGVTTFDLGGQKILNLISIGMKAEEVLKDQIHDVLDKVREQAEDFATGRKDPTIAESMISRINTLEKSLWRKH